MIKRKEFITTAVVAPAAVVPVNSSNTPVNVTRSSGPRREPSVNSSGFLYDNNYNRNRRNRRYRFNNGAPANKERQQQLNLARNGSISTVSSSNSTATSPSSNFGATAGTVYRDRRQIQTPNSAQLATGTTAAAPDNLKFLTPELRTWVTQLMPLLEIYDYDTEGIVQLVENNDFDSAKIQNAVNLIYEEKRGREAD